MIRYSLDVMWVRKAERPVNPTHSSFPLCRAVVDDLGKATQSRQTAELGYLNCCLEGGIEVFGRTVVLLAGVNPFTIALGLRNCIRSFLASRSSSVRSAAVRVRNC